MGDLTNSYIPEATSSNFVPEDKGILDFVNPFSDITGLKPEQSTQSVDPVQDSLNKMASTPASGVAKTAPTFFDWDKNNTDRYTNSAYYKELGFDPGVDNETKYGERQTWSNAIGNAIGGGAGLAWQTFKSGWEGWGNMANALFSWDSAKIGGDLLAFGVGTSNAAQLGADWDNSKIGDKLLGSDADLQAYNDENTRIINKYAIFSTPDSDKSVFNKQFFANMLQQGGFMLGTLAQTASEEILTGGLSTEASLAKLGVSTAKFVDRGITLGETINDAKKLGDIWKVDSIAQNLWKGAQRLIPLSETTSQLLTASKAGAGALQLATIGAGGVKRALAEANMAFTFARMLSAGTYGDLSKKLTQEYIDRTGQQPVGDDLNKITDSAKSAALGNFYIDSGIAALTQRIQFNNLFNKFDTSRSIVKELGEFGDKTLTLTGEEGGIKGADNITRVYDKGYFGAAGNYGDIASDFGKSRAAWEVAKQASHGLMHWEIPSGIQMVLMDISNNTMQDYYYDMYHGTKGYAFGKSLDKAASREYDDGQGVKSFLMGALSGALLSPLTFGLEKGMDRARTSEADRAALSADRASTISTLNEYYKNPQIALKEQIASFKVQDAASQSMEEALKRSDEYTYNNSKDSALANIVTAAKKTNTLGSVLDTMRGFASSIKQDQFKDAFGIDPTQENIKDTGVYINKIADTVEQFSRDYEHLQDKYGDLVLPQLHPQGSSAEFQARVAKKALDDALEILATNRFKSERATERAQGLLNDVAQNKNVGSSSAAAFPVLASEVEVSKQTSILSQEITDLEANPKKTPDITEQISQKKDQLDALGRWKDGWIFQGKEDTDETSPKRSRDAVDGDKAKEAYRDYINSKNAEEGSKTQINDDDVNDTFKKFQDYTDLNADHKEYIDAFNTLADPKKFVVYHGKMMDAIRETLQRLHTEHLEEQGLNREDTLNTTQAGTPDLEHPEASTSGDITEGKEYFTTADPDSAWYNNKAVKRFNNDLIKVIKIDKGETPDQDKITVQVNGDKTYVVRPDQLAKKGKLWDLDNMSNDEKIYFRNRDQVIRLNVNSKNGLPHLITGDHATRDYSGKGKIVSGRLALVKEDGENVLKIKYLNPVSGKESTIDYNRDYYKKYGEKGKDLRTSPTEEEGQEKVRAERTQKNYGTQYKIFEQRVEEANNNIKEALNKREENAQTFDRLTTELGDHQTHLELVTEKISQVANKLDALTGKNGRPTKEHAALESEAKELEKSHGEITQSITDTQNHIDSINNEKSNLDNTVEALKQAKNFYQDAGLELMDTQTPFDRAGQPNLSSQDQEKLDGLSKNQTSKRLTPERVEELINDTQKEIDNISDKAKKLTGYISDLKSVLRGITNLKDFLDYLDLPEDLNKESTFRTYLRNKMVQENDPELKQSYQNLLAKAVKAGQSNGGKTVGDIRFLVSEIRDSMRELGDLQDKLEPTQDKLDRLSQAKAEKQQISSLQDRVNFLNQVQEALTEGVRKETPIAIAKPVKVEGQENMVSDVVPDSFYDPTEPKLPKFEVVGFNKTNGRQYSDDKDEIANTAYGEDRFFGFTAKQNVLGQGYQMEVVTEHNDPFSIRTPEYNPNDVKVVLTKKQEDGTYKYIDQEGKEIETPSKENIVYSSLPNTNNLTPKQVRATYTVGDDTSDEEIQRKIDEHKAYQKDLVDRTKEGPVYLDASYTSPGIQRVERLHDGTIAKAEVEGRLVEDDPDWRNLKSAANPDAHIGLRIETNPNGGSTAPGIKPGRVIMQEYTYAEDGTKIWGDKLTRVFNRELTTEEKSKVTEALVRYSNLLAQHLSITDKRTPKEINEFNMLESYLKNILPWSDRAGKGMFSISQGINKGDLKIPNTEESIRANKDTLLADVYHNVNNRTLESKEPFYDIKQNSDGTFSQGKEWKTYEQYLLDKREGEIPPVYTSLPRADSGIPQRTQSYINWIDPDVSQSDPLPLTRKAPETPKQEYVKNESLAAQLLGGLAAKQLGKTEQFEEAKVEEPAQESPKLGGMDALRAMGTPDAKNKILEENTQEAAKETKPIVESKYPTGVNDAGEVVHFSTEGAVAEARPKDGKLSAELWEENNKTGDIRKAIEATVNIPDGNLAAGRVLLQRAIEAQYGGEEEDSPFRLPIEEFKDKEDFQKLGDYMKQNLPQFSINKMAELIHGKAWGMFKRGALYIYENAGEGTGFHEAFHGVWDSFLTDKEQSGLVKEFQTRDGEFTNPYSKETKPYSEASLYDVKEILADEFAKYIQDGTLPGTSKSRNFFQKLWDHIKSIFGMDTSKRQDFYDSINQVFKGVSAGEFKSLEPIRELSFIPEYKAVNRFTQEETAHTVEGLTYYMFRGLYEQGKNIDSLLSNMNATESNKLLNDLYDSAHNEVLANAGKKGPRAQGVIHDQKYNLYEELKKTIGRYGLDFDSTEALKFHEEDTTNTLGIRDSMSIDPTKMTGVNVKLLLGSLPDMQYNSKGQIVFRRNSLNQPKLVDYNKIHNTLLNELSNVVPEYNNDSTPKGLLDTMLDKLATKYTTQSGVLRESALWLRDLKNRIKYEDKAGIRYPIESLSEDDMRLRIAFTKSFNNSKSAPQKTIINEGGYIYNLNPLENVNTSRVRDEWANTLKTNLDRSGDSLISLNPEGVMMINRDSKDYQSLVNPLNERSIFDFNKALNALGKLGIVFSAGKRDLNKYGTQIREDAIQILTLIRDDKINTIDELYGNNIVGGRINKLLSIEAGFTGESNLLSFLSAEGQPQYAVTIPNAISNKINTLNSVRNLKELVQSMPELGTIDSAGKVALYAYQADSELLKLDGILFDKKGNRKPGNIEYQILSGSGTEGPNGTNTGDMEFSERIADKIHHLLGNTIQSVINSDKSTEYGFKLPGNPLVSVGDVTQFLFDNPGKIIDRYTQQMTSEMAAAVYNKKSPSNIQYYKDQVSSLAVFKDILGERLIQKFQDEVIAKGSKYSGDNAHLQFIDAHKDEINKVLNDYLTKRVDDSTQFLKDNSIFDSRGKLYTSDAIDNQSLDKILGVKGQVVTVGYDNGDPVERSGYTEHDIKTLAGYLEFNEQVLNNEQYKVIFGHPAFYKDLPKRANMYTSTKEMMVQDPDVLKWMDRNMTRNDGKTRSSETNPTITVRSFKDQSVISRFHEDIAEGLYKDMINSGTSKELTEKSIGAEFDEKGKVSKIVDSKRLIGKYLDLNEADALAYGMPDFVRDLLFTTGKLSREQKAQFDYEMAYEKQALSDKGLATYSTPELIAAKKTIDKGDPGYIFQVLKTQYAGYAQDSELMHPVGLKHSVQPKFYRHVEGTQFEPLYLAAKANQEDLLGYESGEKFGNILNKKGELTPIYNEQGEPNLEEGKFSSQMPFQKLYSKFMGIQVETANTAKNSVVRGTQVTKQVMSNFFENGKSINDKVGAKVDEYNRSLVDLMQSGKERLLSKIGLRRDGDGNYETDNLDNLVTTLRQEAIKRELPDNLIEGISSLINEDGTHSLKYKFDTLTNREKIDNILNSIVDSSVISEKLNGKSSVQVASTLYESNPRNYMFLRDGKYVQMTKSAKLTSEEKASVRMTSSDLNFYYNKSGKISQAEVYMTWPYKNVSPEQMGLKLENGIYKLSGNTSIDNKLLTTLGFRIPTQGMNSIESLKIKGFTPIANGDMIVVPSEIVGKAGSDFDIDKLNHYMPNHYYDAGTNELKSIVWKGSKDKTRAYYSDLYDKGELLSPKQRSELSDYISQSKELLLDDPENKLLKSIFSNLYDPSELTDENLTNEYLDELNNSEQGFKDKVLDSFTHKALQNHYMDSMRDLIEDPSNYGQLVTPNSTEALKSLAEEINGYKLEAGTRDPNKDEKSFAYLRSFEGSVTTRQKYLTAKKMVGIDAVNSTFHVLAQLAGLKLSGDFLTRGIFYMANKGEVRRKITTKLEVHPPLEGGEYLIGHTNDTRGNSISDSISQKLSGDVDGAKDPFVFDLNLNLNNSGTWLYMKHLGSPDTQIGYLFAQPIMDKYFEAQSRNKAGFKDVNGEKLFPADLFYQTIAPYYKAISGVDIQAKLASVVDSIKATKRVKEEFITNLNKIADAVPKFSDEDLINNIKAGNNATPEFQIASLMHYLEMSAQSQLLGNFNQAIGYDNRKTRTIQENQNQLSLWEKSKIQGFIANPDSILDNTFLGEMRNQKEDIFNMFRNYFVTLAPGVQKVFEPLENKLANPNYYSSKENRLDLLSRYNNFIVSYIAHTTEVNTESGKQSLNDIYSDLLRGKQSMARELLSYQKSSDPSISESLIIKELLPMINSDTSKTDNISLFRNKLDTFKTNNLIESLDALKNYAESSGNEKLSTFTDNLAKFSLIQSGLQTSRLDFRKVLSTGIYSDFVKQVLDNFGTQELDTDTIWKLFHQNNWNNQSVVPRAPSYVKVKGGVISIHENAGLSVHDFITKSTRKEGYTKSMIDQLKREKRMGEAFEPQLFQKDFLTEKGYWIYTATNKLGDGPHFTEIPKDNGASILSKNGNIEVAKAKRDEGYMSYNQLMGITDGSQSVETNQEDNPVYDGDQPINFSEEPTSGYRNRTIKNASADATIALATDFNSAGEKLTKNSVLGQGKKYIPIDANTLEITPERVKGIVDRLNESQATTLNIAGNGIYTMRGKYSQDQVDEFTYKLLKAVTESPELENKIESIRTGGQTGFDEAGSKAARELGIKSDILAPKGYTFRDITGKDISDESKFKARFDKTDSRSPIDKLKDNGTITTKDC